MCEGNVRSIGGSVQTINILGVKVDKVTLDQAVEMVARWLSKDGKHYIVTPNVEIIMAAQKDNDLKEILNKADLAIPDSARLSWANRILQEKSWFKKLLVWPLFIFPNAIKIDHFPVTTGVDLMEKLCQLSSKQGFRVGLLGGRKGIAEKCAECLVKKYPNLKVVYCNFDGVVDNSGNLINQNYKSHALNLPQIDILFVAFGAPKQEKWIAKNIDRVAAKIMIGVGGAFDYLSREIPRAPKWVRELGFEWLFRLILEPWRVIRFISLLKFIFLVMFEL